MRSFECLRDLDNLLSGFARPKVNCRTDTFSSHVISLFNGSEHNLVEFVRVCKKLVMVDFNNEWNFVRVFLAHYAQYSDSRGNGIASAFNSKSYDIFRIEVIRIFGKRSSCTVLDPLISRKIV